MCGAVELCGEYVVVGDERRVGHVEDRGERQTRDGHGGVTERQGRAGKIWGDRRSELGLEAFIPGLK